VQADEGGDRVKRMTQRESGPGLVLRVFQASVRAGFRRAYPGVCLDADKFLRHVQRTYGLPIRAWKDIRELPEEVVNPVAARIVLSSTRMAALEGMGMGIGGLSTVVPDMGILAVIMLRMLQKLSLIYGFEYSTAEEVIELWVAVASAAGLQLTYEFLERQAAEQIVPRIIDRIAIRVGTEAAEKWAGQLFPLLSAGAAATLNYYFVRSWGRRARRHFLERHRSLSQNRLAVPTRPLEPPGILPI
jgi:EcsC protein family